MTANFVYHDVHSNFHHQCLKKLITFFFIILDDRRKEQLQLYL